MGRFDSPTTEVLHGITLDGTAETTGDVSTWGEIHFGLGRITRSELDANFAVLLDRVGIDSFDILEGVFWILHEDDLGFVTSSGYTVEAEYRAALDELERRWLEFDAA